MTEAGAIAGRKVAPDTAAAMETDGAGLAAGRGAPFLVIEGLAKSFGGKAVIEGLDLEIRRGELFCLLGGSGSGKTTLLRILAGFEAADRGTVHLDGAALLGLPPHRRPVNTMFQSYALFPHMTVQANVGYGLKREGVARDEIDARVAEMLRLVQLEDYGGRKPHQLSGGQQQRVALARALVKRPKLLLLDEPLSALDRRLREQTQFELKRLHEQLGLTFVMVTHDQDEAMGLADRIGVMNAGRLEQIAPPRVIYERPANRFVADFVGTINLFEAHVVSRTAEAALLRLEREGVEVAVPDAPACAAGQRVWFAIRPEAIALAGRGADEAGGGARVEVAGTIGEAAYRGENSLFRVTLQGGREVTVLRHNDRGGGVGDVTAGCPVAVSFRGADGTLLTA